MMITQVDKEKPVEAVLRERETNIVTGVEVLRERLAEVYYDAYLSNLARSDRPYFNWNYFVKQENGIYKDLYSRLAPTFLGFVRNDYNNIEYLKLPNSKVEFIVKEKKWNLFSVFENSFYPIPHPEISYRNSCIKMYKEKQIKSIICRYNSGTPKIGVYSEDEKFINIQNNISQPYREDFQTYGKAIGKSEYIFDVDSGKGALFYVYE